MNLLRFFKKEKAQAPVAVAPTPPRPIVEKPASERFSKTFMPNAARVLEPVSGPMGVSPARPVSFGGGLATGTAPVATPPAERTVALQLAELLPQIPTELLGSAEVDPYQSVVFNASELERGMANGRPAVSLRSIYQQAPAIFTTEIMAEDQREIPLPFHKVLEQFSNFQVRVDQLPDEAVPEVETPFLKVTLEDSAKFGTPLPPPRPVANTLPPEPVAPTPVVAATTPPAPASIPLPATPTPPAPTAPRAPIRLTLPPEPTAAAPAASATPPVPAQPVPTAKPSLPMTSKIFPNGTGAPIPERVPASSGAPVPTPLPSPLAPVKPAPARIPFKVTPPASDLCPPPEMAVSAPAAPIAFAAGSPRVRLSLRRVFESIPPFQLTGSVEHVPEDAKIELPFSILEPQLSLGRAAISPAQFVAAMPEEFRSLYRVEEDSGPVALPLPEILQNLPNETLQMRQDQEEPEVAQLFETPFSQKAVEDAARLKTAAGPIAKITATASPLAAAAPVEPALPKLAPIKAASVEPTPTSPVAKEEEQQPPTSAAKSIVAELTALEGVKACAIVFADGLSLAGNLPAEYEADALCAMAPEVLKRINQQISGANLGALRHLTLFCEKAPVSFFAHENICLAVLHSTSEITPATRGRLEGATLELAREYAAPQA